MKRVFLFCCVMGFAAACQHEKAGSPGASRAPVSEAPSVRSEKEGLEEVAQEQSSVSALMMAYHELGNQAADLVASLEKASAAQRKSIENYDAFASRLKALAEKAHTGAVEIRSITEDLSLYREELASGRLNGDVLHNILVSKKSTLQEYSSVLSRMQPELERIRSTMQNAGVPFITVPHDSIPARMPE